MKSKPWKKRNSQKVRRYKRVATVAIAFGEEQARKAKLQAQRTTDVQNRWAAAEQRYKRALDDIYRTIEAVCFYSAAVPPKEMASDSLPLPWRIPIMPRMSLDLDRVFDEAVTYQVVDTFALRSFCEENFEKLTQAVHLRLGNERHSAYMISLAAFDTMPLDVIARELVPEITKQLIAHLRKAA